MRLARFEPPRAQGYVVPDEGVGVVRHYSDILDPARAQRYTLTLQGRPWTASGRQPFAWEFVSRSGDYTDDVLRIAAARNVRITSAFKAARIVNAATGLNRLPHVEIYRPQDDSLIPSPGQPFAPHRLVGVPYVTGPDFEHVSAKFHFLTTVQVVPDPSGVTIQHLEGAFTIRIRIVHPESFAAFAYEFETLSLGLTLRVNIVHSANVVVTVRATEDYASVLLVRTAKVEPPSRVPAQGSLLDDQGFRFKVADVDVTLSRKSLARIFVFEFAVSLIPIVGALYDIGQAAYAYATGKDFWGQKVTKKEALLMGTLACLPLATESASLLHKVRGITRRQGWQPMLTADALAEIRRVADTGLVDAIGQLDAKAHERLVRMLGAFEAGTIPVERLLLQFSRLVEAGYLRNLEKKLVDAVFTVDLKGFNDPRLAQAYARYRSQRKFRRNPARIQDPVTWAKAQTVGPPRAVLTELLGERFVQVIRRAEGSRAIPRLVTKAEIELYDTLAGRVEDFGSLRNLAAKVGGFGQVFETDHVLEQRFWRNNPRLRTAFDEEGVGLALVVPKNEAIAAQIFRKFGGTRIRYVHATKTRMLKDLIPHGTEVAFTVQEVWDAHAFTLVALGADKSIYAERLVDDFRLMASELGEAFTPLVPTAERFLPENGWPLARVADDGIIEVIRSGP